MRAAFFAMLLINLAYGAWAGWIDAPSQAPPASKLPRLKLVNEPGGEDTYPPSRARGLSGVAATAGPSAAAAPLTAKAFAQGNTATNGTLGVTGGDGRLGVVSGEAGGEASAVPAAGADRNLGTPIGGSQLASSQTSAPTPQGGRTSEAKCVSLGPFNELAVAAKAAGSLRSRGFNPVQRADEAETADGYWVYIGGVADAKAADRIFKTLERNGIKDANLMPETGDSAGRRISVGLFSERERAQRRAKAIDRMGLVAEVTDRKLASTRYWVDLTLKPSDGAIPVGDLLAAGAGSGRVSIQSCPTEPATVPAFRPAETAEPPAEPGARFHPATVAATPKEP